MPEIKLTSEQLSLMSMFQSMTGATARDCVLDEKKKRLIFVVAKGQMGLAIGKDGVAVKKIERAVRRPVEVVEWADVIAGFVKNALGSRYVQEVRVSDRLDGTKGVVGVVDPKKNGDGGQERREAQAPREALFRHKERPNHKSLLN